MISKELLLDCINSHNLPTDDLTVKVEGAFYQILSRREEIITEVKEKINDILPDCYHLFYLSDTSYSLPTRQYSLSFVVK